MKTAEIRSRFLDFFKERGHEVQPSSPLVPADDPTLLFTNAGMVQFKQVFLGREDLGFTRAATSQKCVRAGGKHNDLEEVGRTTRHHTFFEMLGNFSFGDYFKRDAILYAWELMTDVYGLDPERFYATVHHSDDEAAALWAEEIGLPPERIYRLGDKDNFWQMADTGPCGPCSELHYDLRENRAPVTTAEEFVELNDSGQIIELWNLVFMQFDRDAKGTLHPLPAPCVDTGAGLERIAAVLQGADSNYHTDLFLPLIERVATLVGRAYDRTSEEGVSYRVLADHARAVAFLLADGVYPSNEGRGYVLRRILRRGVRHAWLLGRREPTLAGVVSAVIEQMGDVFPDLAARAEHIVEATRSEEERFLGTIEGGMSRFEELASGTGGSIPGEEVFKLYDTFGFPLDLTQLMAEERGYEVDVEGFEEALEAQRARSRADRAAGGQGIDPALDGGTWVSIGDGEQAFVGYSRLVSETDVLRATTVDGMVGLVLRENPFYVESGGQISDQGLVRGQGWTLAVDRVAKVGGATAVFGRVMGDFPDPLTAPLEVVAEVPRDRRNDTLRNHTATHLLHAALRSVLGGHVVQRGSLVAPERLRFDFAHTAPLSPEERAGIEAMVNESVWANHPVEISSRPYAEAVAAGAMALFGEKYADEVRVVHVPGVSMELCGGVHVQDTGDIGLFRIVSESGVAAGVRRIEALTGRGAYRYFLDQEERLDAAASILKTQPDTLSRKAEQLLAEKAELEAILAELRSQGGGGESVVIHEAIALEGGSTTSYRGLKLRARDVDDARKWGDAFLSSGESGVAVLAAEMPGEKQALLAFVTDDMISRGVRADAVVREVAALVGGRGGGRPHMAQAGVEDPARLDEALLSGVATVRSLLAGGER
ncbi:MAG: alanine--tRNA ligase [Gemmatimonadetes bacterium]|nr:alanine--tRNA ligase [Gemmatimonadota bacterium]MDA1104215.1 alanine--tRNA ligase [Gemmatimonadota bacterium]